MDLFRLSNGTWPLPPYYNHRFSNGPIWVDFLATKFVKLPIQSFAVGGATVNSSIVQGYTRSNSEIPSASVTEQISNYLFDRDKSKKRNELYILWGGGNDYFFGANSPKQIAEALLYNADRLTHLGTVYIVNLPPLQYLPYIGTPNSSLAHTFALLAEWHNGNLSSQLEPRTEIRSRN